MSKQQRKCRQYSVEYIKYGFVPSPQNLRLPMCLICEKTFTNEAMKPSRLVAHLEKMHPNKKNQDMSYFQHLHTNFLKRQTINNMFLETLQQNSDGIRASYKLSYLIAKTGNSHVVGEELLLPAIAEVISTVMHKSPFNIIKSIPLSNDTVQRRIDDMALNTAELLYNVLRNTEFSLQIDESTLPGNEALLLGYVRFIDNEQIKEEFLFAKYLETDTKGESIFKAIEQFFIEKRIPLNNLFALATDGARGMSGVNIGCWGLIKKRLPNIITVHCIIHRQHLVAKNISNHLNRSMELVIFAINKIKSSPLNERCFNKLCEESGDEYKRLLLHTEVRWLSKGNSFERFYNLYNTIIEFFENNKISVLVSDDNEKKDLSIELKKIKHDVAYLSDLFGKFNLINLKLQGDKITLIKTKSIITAFTEKLILFKRNLARRQFYQFPKLLQISETQEISEENILKFIEHLDTLVIDMKRRFKDLFDLEVPDWVITPFACNNNIGFDLEEELVDLQTDIELKATFKNSYEDFWLQKRISIHYPLLWNKVKKLLVAFPTSYLVERGFSVVCRLLSKQRNRLDIEKRGDLRLNLTNIEPEIDALILQQQLHPSH